MTLSLEYLRDPFHPELQESHFFSPEDTRLFYNGLKALVTRVRSHPGVLVDICSGSAVVPSQLLLNRDIKKFYSVDISIQAARATQERVLNLSGLAEEDSVIIAADVLATDFISKIKSKVSEREGTILSANPPWIPTPSSIISALKEPKTIKDEQLKSLGIDSSKAELISGGESGLVFVPSILEVACEIGSDQISLNLSSLSDLKTFQEMLATYELKLDFVHLVESICYGQDSTPLVKAHIESVEDNAYYDKDQTRHFLILNTSLSKKGLNSDDGTGLLEVLFSLYAESGNDKERFLEFVQRNPKTLKMWKIEGVDLEKMKKSVFEI